MELEEKIKGLTKIVRKLNNEMVRVTPYCIKDYSNCFKDRECFYYREYKWECKKNLV